MLRSGTLPRCFLVFCLGLAASWARPASAPAAGSLDHFLCYKASAKRTVDVALSDFLDTGAYSAKGMKQFCAPVDKNSEGVSDTTTFLTSYKLKGPHVKQTGLSLTNQFGTYTYDTLKTDSLLVPAGESLAPSPMPPVPSGSEVDHYRCVKARISHATTPFPTSIVVNLTDDFGARSAAVKKPTRICVATDKNGEGIHRGSSHLVCYQIKSTPPASATGVQATDQFGSLAFSVKKDAELCVPSTLTACPVGFSLTTIARADGSSSETRVETGWSGNDHERDVPGGYPLPLSVDCANATAPCGVCTVTGVTARDGSAKAGRCVGNPTTACDTIDGVDADDCGGGRCEVALYPPQATSTGGVALCEVTRITSAVTGSIDNEGGDASLSLRLGTRGYIGGDQFQPCPLCLGDPAPNDGVRGGSCIGGSSDTAECSIGGTCTGGLDAGQPCVHDSVECGGLYPCDLFTRTCAGGPGAGQACNPDGLECRGNACDANGSDATWGATSLDCPPDPMANITGTGTAEPALLTSGNATLPSSFSCDAPVAGMDCPCQRGVCQDSTLAGCTTNADCATCASNADCLSPNICDGSSHCACTVAGVSRRPNACNDSVCTDIGGGQGQCNAGPTNSFCDGALRADGAPYLSCASNADCSLHDDYSSRCGGFDCGTCSIHALTSCFVEPLTATGTADPDHPTLVSAHCSTASSGFAYNSAIGLPGPERMTLQIQLGRRY